MAMDELATATVDPGYAARDTVTAVNTDVRMPMTIVTAKPP